MLLYWPNASFLLPSLRVSYYTQCPAQGRSQDTDWPYGGRRGNWPENELRCKTINWKGLGHQLVQRGYMVWSTCDYKLKAESGFKPLFPDSLGCALMPQSRVEAELQKSLCQHRGQTRTLLQEKAHRTLLHGSVLFPQPNTWENQPSVSHSYKYLQANFLQRASSLLVEGEPRLWAHRARKGALHPTLHIREMGRA